jgi:hypothetical protein
VLSRVLGDVLETANLVPEVTAVIGKLIVTPSLQLQIFKILLFLV